MNLQFYFEKLKDSSSYREFIEKNKDAYIGSCFLVIDIENSSLNKQHFDYYLPKEKKIFSFQCEQACNLVPVERVDEKIPEKLNLDFDIDFQKVEEMIVSKMDQEGIKNKIEKMLFSLQSNEGVVSLIGTVFISGLGLIKVLLDVKSMKLIEFEKKSFFNMLKVSRGKGKDVNDASKFGDNKKGLL